MMTWSFAVCTSYSSTSVILHSIKIQNGDVLVPANSDPSGKWLLKWRRVRFVNNKMAKQEFFGMKKYWAVLEDDSELDCELSSAAMFICTLVNTIMPYSADADEMIMEINLILTQKTTVISSRFSCTKRRQSIVCVYIYIYRQRLIWNVSTLYTSISPSW